MIVDLNTSSIFTISEGSLDLLLILKIYRLFIPLLLTIRMEWNFLGFTIMRLFVNHFIAHSDDAGTVISKIIQISSD